MSPLPQRLAPCLAVLMAALSAGCGAGLITAVAAGDRDNRSADNPAPGLSVAPALPLVPAPGATQSVVVTNAQIAAAAPIAVRLEALGLAVDQRNPTVAGQGASTQISFGLETAPFVGAVADPTQVDVEARLAVLVAGVPIAPSVPVVLVRQPAASLLLPAGASERFLSPFGERVLLRVAGLRSTAVANLQVLVTTRDPADVGVPGQPPPTLSRLASDIRFEADDGGVPVISAFVPGSQAPTQIQLVVRDTVAGQSTPVTNVYYRPEIALALPSQGPTTGGSLLTLIGTALVPFDFSGGPGPAPFAFSAVQLSFAKGGRVTALPTQDFRVAESGSDRLVFTMPPAPDGRPGQVDIVLRVQLGTATAEVVASQVFLFANPDPFFGPRGAVLDRLPVAVAPILLDNAPSGDDAPDFAALTEQGGVAFLQLLLAQQNGMFQRFAAPQQVGNHEVPAERGPRDLCVGDFDGDEVPDILIVNEGAATAVHQLVLGQARPLPPLGAVHRVPAPAGAVRSIAARFDGDALPDVLLVPGPNAAAGLRPHVLLARPLGHGQPAFTLPIDLVVRDFPYEAVEVADLDGDGRLDIALVSATQLKLDVCYGLGDGTFTAGVPLDFTVPGYTPDPESPAVGLHACGDAAQQSLGLVVAGLLSSFGGGPTQPLIAVLRQSSPRVFAGPLVIDTAPLPTEPVGRSLAANIDQQGAIELVVAMRGEPLLVSLGLLQLGPNGFAPLTGGIELGAESPRQIRALAFGRAFPTSPLSPEAKAVFVVHETEIDGQREKRLSTRLAVSTSPGQPILLPPDAGNQVPFPIRELVAGNFHDVSVASGGAVRDAALVQLNGTQSVDEVVLVANDGFGGVARLGNRMQFPGLLPASLVLLPSPPGEIDRLALLDRGSRLVIWAHDPAGPPVQPATWASAPLRAVLPPPFDTTNLASGSRLVRGDVDGDGIADLVALLVFDVSSPGPEDARLALLRGKVNPAPTEFPFHQPTVLTPVHGNAASLALGDFAAAVPPAPRRLELALAVPVGTTPGAVDGDHVRFFRYVPGPAPGDDRFVASSAAGGPQVLLAGASPVRVTAADFDRDGQIDLLVACRGDSTLRLFRNTAGLSSQPGEVDVAAFNESLTSPWLLAAGEPTRLRLSDINGDGNLDALVFTESVAGTSGQRSTSVAIYLSSGTGEFSPPRFVSPARVGNRDATLVGDLGDWNRDGLPDLLLGWDTAGDINLRILFGGTR